jgi:UDP-glucuronate 4-epimerase
MKKKLITETSWFIGYHLSKKLLERWEKVVWVDNENSYYDPKLKADRCLFEVGKLEKFYE